MLCLTSEKVSDFSTSWKQTRQKQSCLNILQVDDKSSGKEHGGNFSHVFWAVNDTSDTSKYRFILQILIIFTGGQEQQSMKEILATLARTVEGGDQLPSYEGLSMSLPNNFNPE